MALPAPTDAVDVLTYLTGKESTIATWKVDVEDDVAVRVEWFLPGRPPTEDKINAVLSDARDPDHAGFTAWRADRDTPEKREREEKAGRVGGLSAEFRAYSLSAARFPQGTEAQRVAEARRILRAGEVE